MTHYLIDGYNVLHAFLQTEKERGDSDAAELNADELARRRDRLLDRIASYVGSSGDRALVVFDSSTSALQKAEDATRQVSVAYGSFRESADDIIERRTFSDFAGKDVVVVTSDIDLQRVTFRAGVSRRSARQFVDELQRHTTEVANRKKCIRMEHRVENRLDAKSLARLKAIRDRSESGRHRRSE